MGIGIETLGFVHKCFLLACPKLDFRDKYMLELGNQLLNKKVTMEGNERVSAKTYFERIGFYHYSIDWNGRNGAHSLDLSKPITDKFWQKKFDVLTNLGTSEHVLNQYECFKNIHNFVKVNGVFIHVLPYRNLLPKHSPFSYDRQFFRDIAGRNGYEILCMDFLSTIGHIGVCMVKKEDFDFMPEEDFNVWLTKLTLDLKQAIL